MTLSGRTLNRWLDGKNQEKALKNTIKRIAEQQGYTNAYDEPIRLILYSDEGIEQEIIRIANENSKDRLKNELFDEKNNFMAFCV